MFRLFVTGGAAVGKSTAMVALRESAPAGSVFFDCDACVHDLLKEPDIVDRLTHRWGLDVLLPDGGADRAVIRKKVFQSPAERIWLESQLHPAVRERCQNTAIAGEAKGAALFIAEVPLLFESSFPVVRDAVLVIATSPQTQLHRLQTTRRLDAAMAQHILDAQWPIMKKVALADFVIWNEGATSSLQRQVQWVLKAIRLPSALRNEMK